MNNSFMARLDDGVRRLPFWEFHTGLALLLATGLGHCAHLLVAPPLFSVRHDATLADGSPAWAGFSTEWILVRVGVAVVGAGVLLLRRSGAGLLLSAACLVWAGAEYLRWHLLSRALMRAVPALTANPEAWSGNALFFGATNWNVAVLTMIGAVLVWELMVTWKAARGGGDAGG